MGQELAHVYRPFRVGDFQNFSGQFEDRTVQGLCLHPIVLRQRQRFHPRLEKGLGLREVHDSYPLQALDDELNRSLRAGHLLDDCLGTDKV